jgi:kynurenine formamidase
VHYRNLENRDRLVSERFTFIGFPLRVRGGIGSPVRAVLEEQDRTGG